MNFKKILATLLAVVMVLGTVSFSFAEDNAIFEIEEVEEIVELFEVEEAEENLAKIGTTGYLSFAEAYEAANDGDTITVLKEVTLTEKTTWTKKIALNGATFATADMLTLADGASLAGKNITGTVYTAANATVSVNIPNADLIANGDITFKGDCVVKSFSVKYVGTTIKIGKDATLACAGSGRMVIGHGCKFLIEGNIADAKTATTEDIKPSLTVAGASFTGNGVTFNVTNAYVKFTAYCSSKNSSASGTHNYNITNSIWDQTGTFVFSAPTSGMDPTFNLTVKDSIFKSTSHFVIAAAKSNVVIDNSIVNKDNNQQIENRGTLTIKNGSVVNGAVATSENAKNPGTVIVDNATYSVTGEYSGSDLGTGNLIVRNNGKATVGSASNTAITVDGTSCLKAEKVLGTSTITIDTSKYDTGKVLDLNEGASREGNVTFTQPVPAHVEVTYGTDGDVDFYAPAFVVDGKTFDTIEEAFKAVVDGSVIDIHKDITIDYKWNCNLGRGGAVGTFNNKPVTINGNGHTLKFTGEINDGYNNLAVLRTEADLTVKNLTFDMSEAKSVFQNKFSAISSEGGKLVVEKCNFIGNPVATKARAIMYGETNKSAEAVANADVTVTGCTFTNWYNGVVDGENGYDATKVTIENNTFTNANVNISASEKITFNNNTLGNGWVHILSYSPVNNLEVVAEDNTLEENGTEDTQKNYIKAAKVTADGSFVKTVAMVDGKAYLDLGRAIADAAAKATAEAPVTVQLTEGVHEVGTIMFPATAKNIIIKGAVAEDSVSLMAVGFTKKTVLKNSKIVYSGGNNATYENIIIDGIGFDNSSILMNGASAGVTYKNWTITNCEFKNIKDEAAVYFSIRGAGNAVENFTFTNNVIDGVTGTNKSGLGISKSKGTVIISGNTIKNVNHNAIQCIDVEEGSSLVIANNVLSSKAEEGVVNLHNVKAVTLINNTITVNEGQKELGHFTTVAKIGNTYYSSLAAAISGAETGDEIDLLGNTIVIKDLPADPTNGRRWFDTDGKALTIKNGTFDLTDANVTDAVFRLEKAGTQIVFNNVDVVKEIGGSVYYFVNLDVADTTVKFNNCDFDIEGNSHSVIANTAGGAVEVVGCDIKVEGKNFIYRGGALVKDSTFTSETGNIINHNEFDSVIDNTTAVTKRLGVILSGKINIINGSYVYAKEVAHYVAPTDATYCEDVITVDATSTLEAKDIDMNLINDASEGKITSEANSVYIQFRQTDIDANGVDTKEGLDEYEIVIAGARAASASEIINELASADITFDFFAEGAFGMGDVSYFVAPADGVSLTNPIGTSRYMFNYNGADKYEETGAAIVIGKVTVEGYGKYTLGVKDLSAATKDTNAVYATEIKDNIVDGFVPAAGLVINEDLIADDGMVGRISEKTIAVPVRTLTVVVDFPNEVKDQVSEYQAMKVEITGNIDGKNQTIPYELGGNMTADGKYVVEEDRLVLSESYTVTVTGEGYRTARYTVTMTDDKTINFWNNVMDEEHFIEESVDGSKTTKNFLAGDIVKDNNINIYDLSAVVSYFAKVNNGADYAEYVKYDLNRDGVIDSKDVAYVLVSWNE